ncbi:MAG: hypothetical protein LBD78_10925 [Spirochaetaceae bacterium]|jgi:hypothetical protein|nr:hypothetical protein [Spirochaetaceae bacterium]
MIQFYFLSIFLNALTGYLLITEKDQEDGTLETVFRFSLQNETLRLVLGILTMLVGLLKILSSVEGDIPVIGDLVPALAGIGAGFVLVYEYYRSRAGVDFEGSGKIEAILTKQRRLAGTIALASAALHFLFPQVLLL